jgi:hypothetical protein
LRDRRAKMTVYITAIGAITGDSLSDFNPRKDLPNRKHLKMMTRDVRLGVGAVVRAIEACPAFASYPPNRRGLYVGGAPVAAEPEDLARAVSASMTDGAFDPVEFGASGIPCVPPLWLVKGLSNNIMGFSTHYFDIQGHNVNRCDGLWGSIAAVVDGFHALNEGRVDIAIVGGADSLVAASAWIDRPVSEAGVFLVLERTSDRALAKVTHGALIGEGEPNRYEMDYGSATGILTLKGVLAQLDSPTVVSAVDSTGAGALVTVCPV